MDGTFDPSDPCNLREVPAVEAYTAALAACKGGMTANQLLMLRAHYRAPRHTVTAGDLGREVGYRRPRAGANLQYGKFALSIRKFLERTGCGPMRDNGSSRLRLQVSVLVAFGTQDAPERILWRLHPSVASALERLGWFDTDQPAR